MSIKAFARIALSVAGGAACMALGGAAMATESHSNHADHAVDTIPLTQVGNVAWDADASAELTQALHDLHVQWNEGDITSLKDYMIGDDVLITFELDPRTHQPVTLDSKEKIDAFISNVDTTQTQDALVTELEHPKLRCRATSSWGVCTEQCVVHFRDRTNGAHVATDHLVSTQVAVKTEEGWRWIQWHMSQAAPAGSVAYRAE